MSVPRDGKCSITSAPFFWSENHLDSTGWVDRLQPLMGKRPSDIADKQAGYELPQARCQGTETADPGPGSSPVRVQWQKRIGH